MALKIVCDTNTLVSGFLWRGNEFKLLEAVVGGKATLYTSKPLLEEFARVLNYERLRPFVADRQLLVKKLANMCIMVAPSDAVYVIKEDPTDDRVLECALAADADYIVSGDKKHLLKLKQFHAIQIITTQTMLRELEK